MKLDKRIICMVIVCLLSISMSGCFEKHGESSIIIPSVSTNPKYAMASYYSSEGLIIDPQVAQYDLPLDLISIVNFANISSRFDLDDEQKALLQKNGFAVIDYGIVDDIIRPYKDMKIMDIPIFVTSDTLLHLYHIQFDEILKGVEEREFYDAILDIGKAMFEKAKEDYQTFAHSDLKEASRRNVAYFAVGLSLLQTSTEGYNGSEDIREIDFTIPDYVKDEVNNEISNIENHQGFSESSVFHYEEDYSQYVPRGHYTQSEKLKRYFKTMMWYGRIAFLMKGGEPHGPQYEFLISEEDAKIATIQASLISTELPIIKINGKTAEELWNRIYSVTSFFVGNADDLTPYEYLDCIKKVFGLEFIATEFTNETKLLNLKVELAKLRNPQIYGGTGQCIIDPPFTKERLYEVLEKTKGMRFMGQRFIPDSYMFQQLVSPAVGMYNGENCDKAFTCEYTGGGPARCFPRELDIMAVLGSERAKDILEKEGDTQYEGVNTSYYKQLNVLRENFSKFNITEWNRNLYWSWLYTLKSLLKEFNESYPTFMQTTAWRDKELQTALASWTELRHDTILYAKQSYTPRFSAIPPQPKPVVGYVEPLPEFYSRILSLTKMTENGLTNLNVLNETETNRLQNLETVLQRLINITKDELENKELTESDYKFIRNFGENLDSIVTGVKEKGKETTIIADVHTDTNTEKCLEEGVGCVDLILVAYKVPDGRIMVGAGPVFSYYEFKHPMKDRLTDEKWKEMLQDNSPPRPDWTSTFIAST